MNTPRQLFDMAARRLHLKRAHQAGMADFLYIEAARGLEERLFDLARTFHSHIELSELPVAVRAPGEPTSYRLSMGPHAVITADADCLPIADNAADLVTALLGLHWIDDLPGALIQINRALQPDGFFAGVMLGGETLWELRACLLQAESEVTGAVSPRVSPMADLRDLGGLLQRAGFAMPVADHDRLAVSYADMFALMYDLRAMGETNALVERLRRFSPRRLFLRAAELYAERYARGDGRIIATFDLCYLTGWAPAAGQPRPLAPGSAKARFVDVLPQKS